MKKHIELIRCGCTRNVVLFWKYAIKTPSLSSTKLFRLGLIHNKKEKTVTRLKITKSISPVVFSFFDFIVVSKRAERVSHVGLFFLDLAELSAKNPNLSWFFMRDAKPCNFGYINGRLVKVDYGS